MALILAENAMERLLFSHTVRIVVSQIRVCGSAADSDRADRRGASDMTLAFNFQAFTGAPGRQAAGRQCRQGTGACGLGHAAPGEDT